MIGLFTFGILTGTIVMGICLILFTDMSWEGFREKLLHLDILKVAGAILLILVSSVSAIFLQIILHEGGHWLMGLLNGFRFVSFRIGSFTLLQENGRYRIKRFSIAGTGGQCLMLPPEKNLSIPFAWYNAGGVLINLLTATAAAACVIFLPGNMPFALKLFLILFACMGFFLAITNGIPMKPGGVPNDGYNMRKAFADPNQMESLALQLRVNALNQEGLRLKEMPAHWFDDLEVTDYSQLMQVNALAMCGSWYADKGDYPQAKAIYTRIMQHKDKLLNLFVKEYTCELMLLELLDTCDPEEVDKLYTDEIKTYVDQHKKHMPGKQLLACAYALFREKNPEKAKAIRAEVIRDKDRYLMQGEVRASIALMEEMFTRAGQQQG